jgi:hypothetical protein
MALPRLKTPLFDVTIPSTNKDAKFRPFLVREEKILLMAQSTGERKSLINALQQIINNCVVGLDGVKIDINKLTTFDLEYLFLKIRAKSVDNIVELTYTDNEDEKEYSFKVSLDDITIQKDDTHSNKISLEEGVGLVLQYPTAVQLNEISDELSVAEITAEVVKNSISQIYDEDTVYDVKDVTPEELNEFIDNLPVKAYESIQKFLETMPKMYHKIEYKNSKGTDRVIELTTLEDFFTFV